MARKGGRGCVAGLHNEDIGFDMQRLFDEYNMDHIPTNKRLDGFAHRNLPHVKHYKAAVNIFGGPISRKRTIIAPPMETPLKRKLGMYMYQRQDPAPPVLNSELKSTMPLSKVMSSSEVLDQRTTRGVWNGTQLGILHVRKWEEKEQESNYKKWLLERQALRGNLDSMGLSEAMLARKTNKSELEKRVQAKMRAARLWKPETPPPPEPEPEEKEPPVVPSMKVPVPVALQTLDKFLTEKKMRLIDLFRNADTNKDWKLTKTELLAAVKKYQIPLTVQDVESLMVSLDNNFDELLDFKEVSRGLAALKMERRANRRGGQDTNNASSTLSSTPGSSQQRQRDKASVGLTSSPLSKMSSTLSRDLNSNQNSNETGRADSQKGPSEPLKDKEYKAEDIGEVELTQTEKAEESGGEKAGDSGGEKAGESGGEKAGESSGEKTGESGSGSGSGSASPSRSGSAQRSRTSTPNSLEPPPPDLREERRMGSSPEEMVELRKHDKAVLERCRQKKWPWPAKRGGYSEAPGVIRIGHKEVDNHCMESTLEGEVGDLMNQFRRNCLREYFNAIRMCQEKGIVLTPELLDRVLLYPAEMPRHIIQKKLALPQGPLSGLDQQFARPPKKPKTPPEIRHKDKMKRSKNGSLMIDVRHMYPPASKVAPVISKENLSTGRALVSRRSDIWMSFEEYDQYTKAFIKRRPSKTFDADLLKPGMRGKTFDANVLDSDEFSLDSAGRRRNKHLPRRYKKLNITMRGDNEDSDTSNITGYTRSSARSSVRGKKGWGGRRRGGYELDEEKFWPGYMLQKLALYEPSPDQAAPWSEGGMAVFHNTRQPKRRGNVGHIRVTGPVIHPDGRILVYGIDNHRTLSPIPRKK